MIAALHLLPKNTNSSRSIPFCPSTPVEFDDNEYDATYAYSMTRIPPFAVSSEVQAYWSVLTLDRSLVHKGHDLARLPVCESATPQTLFQVDTYNLPLTCEHTKLLSIKTTELSKRDGTYASIIVHDRGIKNIGGTIFKHCEHGDHWF